MSKQYVYFVGYACTTHGALTFANAEISFESPIESTTQLVALPDGISRRFGVQQVTILGLTLLRTIDVE